LSNLQKNVWSIYNLVQKPNFVFCVKNCKKLWKLIDCTTKLVVAWLHFQNILAYNIFLFTILAELLALEFL